MKSSNLKPVQVLVILVVCLSAFSCAKKSTKTRVVKTTPKVISAQTTAESVQLAEQQNIRYLLNSVSIPEQNQQGEWIVFSEVVRQSQYLPFSTTHGADSNAYGVYDDAGPGTKLDIRARCIGSECEKYVLLVTIVKNGYAYHQIAAISFSQDNFFYMEERNYQRMQLYSNVDEVLTEHAQLRPGN